MTAPTQHESMWKDMTGVAFTQGYLDAGGVKTRYLRTGSDDKPLLILIHGTGGHAEAYTRNMQAHGEHFNTYAIDLVGHGYSDKPDQDYEIKDYAKHVLDIIDALGYEKAHVSGESLGGWVAAYLGIHHADKMDRLVLNTAGGWTMFPEVMERIKRLSMEAVNDPTVERIRTRLEFLMHIKSKVNDDLVDVRRTIYSQPGFPKIMEKILCLQEPGPRKRNLFTYEESGKITSPTLVLWTSHDPTASPEEGKKIADSIPGAQFSVMNECGHWPQFEEPEEFDKIHIDFLLGK